MILYSEHEVSQELSSLSYTSSSLWAKSNQTLIYMLKWLYLSVNYT
jgi:hypothetical protein